MPDFLPLSDSLLLAWAVNFSNQLNGGAEAFGVDPSAAAAFAVATETYAGALTAAVDPATRTRPVVAQKSEAAAAMKNLARQIAHTVRAFSSVTDAQRVSLGLLPKRAGGSAIGIPATAPLLEILAVSGRRVQIQLTQSGIDGKGKSPSIAGAAVYSAVGPAWPIAQSGWTFQGNQTRNRFTIAFDATVAAGSAVWIMAAWHNPRGQRGPGSAPRETYVGGGVADAA